MSDIKVLSLDGGGIRGVIALIWLVELEKKLNKPLHEYFDLIVGTSTGSIIACSIASGITAEKTLEMYIKFGSGIFDKSRSTDCSKWWVKVKNFIENGIFRPKYSGEGLNKVLRGVFKKQTLSDLKVPTMITAYNLRNRKPLMFKSHKVEHSDLLVHKACKASSSAPTFFPAEIMQIEGVKSAIIDGGVIANNPSLLGVVEAMNVYEECCTKDIILVSFGTGESIKEITIENSQTWGALEWGGPIVDILFDGSSASVDYMCKRFLDVDNYFRFQVQLDDDTDDMDNCCLDNLNKLCLISKRYLDDGGMASIDKLVSKIQS